MRNECILAGFLFFSEKYYHAGDVSPGVLEETAINTESTANKRSGAVLEQELCG
jgi:hypothetical protein